MSLSLSTCPQRVTSRLPLRCFSHSALFIFNIFLSFAQKHAVNQWSSCSQPPSNDPHCLQSKVTEWSHKLRLHYHHQTSFLPFESLQHWSHLGPRTQTSLSGRFFSTLKRELTITRTDEPEQLAHLLRSILDDGGHLGCSWCHWKQVRRNIQGADLNPEQNHGEHPSN